MQKYCVNSSRTATIYSTGQTLNRPDSQPAIYHQQTRHSYFVREWGTDIASDLVLVPRSHSREPGNGSQWFTRGLSLCVCSRAGSRS